MLAYTKNYALDDVDRCVEEMKARNVPWDKLCYRHYMQGFCLRGEPVK